VEQEGDHRAGIVSGSGPTDQPLGGRTGVLAGDTERQLAAATAEIGVATADLFPKFSLIGSAGLQSLSTSDWFTSGSRVWSIGPTVSWAILDGGKDSGKHRGAVGPDGPEASSLRAGDPDGARRCGERPGQLRAGAGPPSVARRGRPGEPAVPGAGERALRERPRELPDGAGRAALAPDRGGDLTQSEATMATNLVALYKALGGGWEGR
jgi:Outer membrane efflux protein